MNNEIKIIIAAGGTGGHIFPAVSLMPITLIKLDLFQF